jgi:hypothetical protein
MRAETPASVEEQFSSRAGLGASESTQAGKLAVSLVLRARVEQVLAARYSPGQIARPGQCSGWSPRQRPLGEKGPSAPLSPERV